MEKSINPDQEAEMLIKILFSALLALVPVIIWGYIFYQKDPQSKRLTLLTFVGGMMAVVVILLYKWSWQFFPEIDLFKFSNQFSDSYFGISNFVLIPVSVLVTFGIIGLLEEYGKNIVVRVTDKGAFKSVDDAITFSIVAALGFSFLENILYFYYIWQFQTLANLFIPFIFRSLFSTFAHVFFSGIYGYFYGIACFAAPYWQDELRENRGKFVILLHKILSFKSVYIFSEIKIMEGLVYAVLLHAAFNIFLEMNWTFLIVPFLFTGFFILTHLLDQKEYHKIFNQVVEKSQGS